MTPTASGASLTGSTVIITVAVDVNPSGSAIVYVKRSVPCQFGSGR